MICKIAQSGVNALSSVDVIEELSNALISVLEVFILMEQDFFPIKKHLRRGADSMVNDSRAFSEFSNAKTIFTRRVIAAGK